MRTRKVLFFTFAALLVAMTWPATAQAQRRGFHGPSIRVGVGFGGGYLFDPYYQYPYPYPYGYGYPRPYGYGYGDGYDSALRLEVKPRQADVYVDGFHAGIVDDFDGIFQRLDLQPGGHEIVLFLEGFRTVRRSVYLNPHETQSIKLQMDRLGPGESSGPRPVPPPPQERPAPNGPGYGPQGGIRAGRPQPMQPGGYPPQPGAYPPQPPDQMPPGGYPPPPPPDQNPGQPMGNQQMGRMGTLAIRVDPADAEIWLDGSRYQGPQPRALRSIELPEGKHKLELKKAGFDSFSADVMVRGQQTTTVNVTLTKGQL